MTDPIIEEFLPDGIPEDDEAAAGMFDADRTRVEIGMAHEARRLTDQLALERERKRVTVAVYDAGIQQLVERIARVTTLLGSSLQHRVKHEEHPKLLSIPGAGSLRQRTQNKGGKWKVTDNAALLAWLTRRGVKTYTTLEPSLDSSAVLAEVEAIQALAEEGEDIPGLVKEDEYESTSFKAEGH